MQIAKSVFGLKAKNLAFSKDGSATVFKTVQVLLGANTGFLPVETDLAKVWATSRERGVGVSH